MDQVVVDYLNSGQAWLIVGSGPSTQMGYPDWSSLAGSAASLIRTEGDLQRGADCDPLIAAERWAEVFQLAADTIGWDRLLEVLRDRLHTTTDSGPVYRLLARWPAAVYLTTNFDNEIARHLAKLGLAYEQYSNSQEHMSLLNGEATGIVLRLHGDLSSPGRLVLSSQQYGMLSAGGEFEYWRTRMTSIFQMQKIVVIGYSLSDPHIRQVLEAAKSGATAIRPVCWIAPDVTTTLADEYLNKYRIRLIPYPAAEGHSGLAKVVETISEFVVPREGVSVRRSVASVVRTAKVQDPGATAVYVFNRLAPQVDLKDLRRDVALAAVEATLPELATRKTFTIVEAIEATGWPKDAIDPHLANEVRTRAIKRGMLVRNDDRLAVSTNSPAVRQHRIEFDHLRNRFLQSTALRIQRECPWIEGDRSQAIARDVDAALTGFFKQGGLTLATLLIMGRRGSHASTVPQSIIPFVSEASAQYETYADRLAFWRGSLTAFTEAGEAERQYLGRLAQGFFAFHAVGVFGETAREQMKVAKQTVWLIDSSLQIPALAIASPSNAAHIDTFRRLATAGVRLFSTTKLFEETFEHLGFAKLIVSRHGADSQNALAAATGDTPYWRQNLFLQGYVEWQLAGGGASWETYLHACFGARDPSHGDVERALNAIGVSVVDFQDWPGFKLADFAERDGVKDQLKKVMRRHRYINVASEQSYERWLERKVEPEAEAAVVALRERSGEFGAISGVGIASPSFFVSATSALNTLDRAVPVTWQPEAFMAFVGTLINVTGASSDRAFEVVLSSIARAGVNPISDAALEAAFGAVVDEAVLGIADQREALVATLGDKYSERPEDVIRRLPLSQRLLVSHQISAELVAAQQEQLDVTRQRAQQEGRRAAKAEEMLADVARLQRQLEARRARELQRKRRAETKKRRA
ncbi:MAG: SIR2 family protein [Actinomycetota bacterium]